MSYRFFRQETGEYEVVDEHEIVWKWVASYDDGTLLKQFGDDGVFHQFKEIDQPRLVYFHLVSDVGRTKTITFRPGMKLIHFYRNTVLQNGQIHLRMTVIGWEAPGEKVLMVVMPNDEVIVTDDLDSIGFNFVTGEQNG